MFFLIFHNIFYHLQIIPGYSYQPTDYIRQFVKLIIMTDYELLIRPFWFIKILLYSSVIVATISLICYYYFPRIKSEHLLIISLIAAFAAKYLSPIPVIGDVSVILFAVVYFYSGVLIQKYKHIIPMTSPTLIISSLIVVAGSFLFVGDIDMRYTTTTNIIPYYLLSIAGIIMTLSFAKKLDKYPIKNPFHYIGNHTMPILSLNLLVLKIGSIIKIWIYDLPVGSLSSYPIISEHNSLFWLYYSIIGITVPLLIDYIYQKVIIHKS